MARSVWKGPFVDGYLLKKADTVRASGRNEVIKTWSRRSTVSFLTHRYFLFAFLSAA